MRRTIRVTAFFIALTVVAVLFSSCSGGTVPETTTETTTAAPVSAAGYTLRIAGYEDQVFAFPDETGAFPSALKEAQYHLLQMMQEAYGFTLRAVSIDRSLDALTAAHYAGLTEADFIYVRQNIAFPLAKRGMLAPLDSADMLSYGLHPYDADMFFVPVSRVMSFYENAVWGVTVASRYVQPQAGYCVAFNRALCAEAGYPDTRLYDLVREKQWTWEVYLDIAYAATKNDAENADTAVWGTGTTAWGAELLSNGVNYVSYIDGKYQLGINNEAGMEGLMFLHEMNDMSGTRPNISSDAARDLFAAGRVALHWVNWEHLSPGARSVSGSVDFGILPAPLGPRGTDYVAAHDNCHSFVLLSNHPEKERAVAATVIWARTLNDPHSYQEWLDDGRCRTDQDKEMYRLVLNSFAWNSGKLSREIWDVIDGSSNPLNPDIPTGIIADVSYNGRTPAQALEKWGAVVNARIMEFFSK